MIRFLSVLLLAAATALAVAPAAKKKPTRKTAAKKKTARKTASTWRNTQRIPAPERYKEIQQALAGKGYLEPNTPTGVWGTSSVAALKRFQEDQNLAPSGKIDSLSLIALGLGPRRDPQPPPQP